MAPLIGRGPLMVKAAEEGYKDTVLADSPVYYWRLGESSGTTAVDYQGNQDATYSGSGITYSKNGIAGVTDGDTGVETDGSSGEVRCMETTGQGPDLTIEFWIKPLQTTAGRVGTNDSSGSNSNFFIIVNRNDVEGACYFDCDRSTDEETDGTTFTTNAYNHVVMVSDTANDEGRLYVNDSLIFTVAGSIDAGEVVKDFYLGNQSTKSAYLNAVFDECAVYDKVLSESRISAHYSAGT